MPEVSVTNREIKNLDTGIDITVPQYEIQPGLLGATVTYQVLVVTNLAHFKGSHHEAHQIVQCVISHKYSEFEALCNLLDTKFRSVVLPSLPSKTFVIGEAQIKDRRTALDAVMKYIAQSPRLSQSHEVLQFLGVQKSKIEDVLHKKDEKVEDVLQEASKSNTLNNKKDVARNVFDSDEDTGEIDVGGGLFDNDVTVEAIAATIASTNEVPDTSTGAASSGKYAAGRLFNTGLDLYGDEKSSSLQPEIRNLSVTTETHSELDDILGSTVSDFENLLVVNQDEEVKNPSRSIQSSRTVSDVTNEQSAAVSSAAAAAMDHNDITDYISTLASNDNQVSLFD